MNNLNNNWGANVAMGVTGVMSLPTGGGASAGTWTAIRGILGELAGGLRAGLWSLPLMLNGDSAHAPAYNIPLTTSVDVPATTTDTNGEQITHFYRAMSNAEYSSTLGYLQDRNSSGEGPHVRADIGYLLSASFINKANSPYNVIVEYRMLQSSTRSFYLTPYQYVPGTGSGGTIFNVARATGLNYLKYEKGVSIGFPGNSTILFNSALITPPRIYKNIK
ncbi:hypothetical protein ACM39_12940 [Chryseobacterium sp. FH2]|uniref:hypothetical protein n=1 Tax=Chryseobacterium sp. FH2 TaxID=1674291 RepID=UPI00065AFCF9|nr:hypothetical protein [Chryseobacterium sp. FH2]KMQ67738.1 hypothetical protein ACM39_12940 [Chryseobacterium sp. FH2]